MVEIRRLEEPVIDARGIWRDFGARSVLRGVSLSAGAGEIHALLGPNGAGKTTLLRILTGLIEPTRGHVLVDGVPPRPTQKDASARVGFVSSSDRSFYLRISGLENLVFFARLHGMSRREALVRGRELLEQVGLDGAGRQRAYEYSHGMLKRLGFARALLGRPSVLLVDEATHDLDPEGAMRMRELTRRLAVGGAAVVWTTQRIEEIQGLADAVSVLVQGEIRFRGTVPELAERATSQAYVMTIRNGGASGHELSAAVQDALGGRATVSSLGGEDDRHFGVVLTPGVVLGDAFTALAARDLVLIGCREERPGIEDAFMQIAGGNGT